MEYTDCHSIKNFNTMFLDTSYIASALAKGKGHIATVFQLWSGNFQLYLQVAHQLVMQLTVKVLVYLGAKISCNDLSNVLLLKITRKRHELAYI